MVVATDRHGFGLVALVLGAILRIVAEARHQVLEAVARGVERAAAAVEDREAAAAAIEITFVGRGEGVDREPGDGVGLARYGGERGRELDQIVLVVVDLGEVDRAGGEVAADRTRGQVDDREVVVLLERHHGLVGFVDGHELGLGIRGEAIRDAGEVDRARGPVCGHADQVDDHQATRGRLRRCSVAEILVTLVLDHHCCEAFVRAHGHAVGLPADIDRADDRAAGDVDHLEQTRGGDEALAGVDAGEGVRAGHHDRCRLAANGNASVGEGQGGIADVDESRCSRSRRPCRSADCRPPWP